MKKSRAALLTAITLLCGCSGNSEPSETESTSEPPAITVEVSVPELTDAPQSDAPAGITGGDNADSTSVADGSQGVDLESGSWTENDNLFKLNGTWCTLEELPLTKTEYQLPGKWSDKQIKYEAKNGMLQIIATDIIPQQPCPPEVWYIDLATGEERLVYTGGVFDNIVYTGEKYVAALRTGIETDELIVVSVQTGETVYQGNCRQGNYSLTPYLNSQAIHDTMYIGGEYTLPDFNKTVDAIFTLDLLTSTIDLFGINMSGLAYGSANLCWNEGGIKTNLLGEISTPYAHIGDKIVTSDMEGSYYTTTQIGNYTDILGSRYQLYWTDHEAYHESNESGQHFVGETGYSVSPYDFHITKDYIFTTCLGTEDGVLHNILIGKFDIESDTAQAALISVPASDDFINTYVDNSAAYIVNYTTGKITMFSAGDNS